MNQNRLFLTFCLLLFAFSFSLSSPAQDLTVRDIMREPSIAGMRPDSEKLSPDGKYVVYAWNPDGKEPRNLYIVDTDGRAVRLLVDAEANFEQRTLPPESKLNYGLQVRDDFVKAREKNLGGVEFSPDSRRILFLQNTDIYVLDLEDKGILSDAQKKEIASRWRNYEAQITRRADLTPNLLKVMMNAGVKENDSAVRVAEARAALLNALNEKGEDADGGKSAAQRARIVNLNNDLGAALEKYRALDRNDAKLRASELLQNVVAEMVGNENRMNVARVDYEAAIGNARSLAKPRRVTRTQGFEGGARWLTNDAILYSSAGNYFVLNLKETSLVQVTKEANPQAFVSIFNVNPTKDGKSVAYVLSDGSKQRALFVPNYLDEFVQANSTRRGFSEQKVFVTLTDGSREKPFEISLPKAEGAGYIRSLRWAADNSSLVVDRVDKDLKRRQLFYVHDVGSKAEQTILVTEETDPKWIAPLSALVEPNPENDAQVLFASERDGFNHLYLATLERAGKEPNKTGEIRQENPTDAGFTTKVDVKQLTKGNYQIEWAKWSENGNALVFSSTEANTAERQFYEYLVAGGEKTQIFYDQKGMRTAPQLSDESSGRPVLLYEFSQWNQPTELYAIEICPRCRGMYTPDRLTNSIPDAFTKTKWSAPRFVDIPTRDGKTVKSKVYLPAGFDAARKYPMVMFVHGAGYLQNTINGWNNYYREFMFNDLLTRRGYVVLDIDYRGSAGYGRDWRTDVHDFLGGKDYEDHLDAIDYAVKNYAVNPQKIGVYGGSYGGFIAEMLAFRSDKIAAAAALRPVADWKNYYASSPVYTVERLGFPEKNAEAYKRSSPIAYADGLNKPLLILHGLVDDNVHAQDSMQLIEKLMRLEKTPYFEAMIYPSENHGFQRPTSWADEYERILNFFEKHLK